MEQTYIDIMIQSLEKKEKVLKTAKDAVCISVNFDYPESDYIFLSNLRRYKELPEESLSKAIVTSNITSDKVYLQTKYRDLLNDVEAVRDNAGLMAIKFLMSYGVAEIKLAGFDGYSPDGSNYVDSYMMSQHTKGEEENRKNRRLISDIRKLIDVSFITDSLYEIEEDE